MLIAGVWTLLIVLAEAAAVVYYFGWPWWLVPLYPLVLWCGVLSTWLVYLAAMNLIRAREDGQLTTPAKVLGGPIVVYGFVVLDCLVCNMLIGHAMFLGVRFFPLTATVSYFKHHRPDAPIRQAAARYICANFLDVYDRRKDGLGHCRP